jgi:hypothetical protein
MQDTVLPQTPRPDPSEAGGTLPLSKLRGLSLQVRALLKLRRITTCGQLLDAAATPMHRARLARATGIPAPTLLELARRADMARVNGIGTVFGLMLEDLNVNDVATLAAQDPQALHDRLKEHNRRERIARRSPTPEEVAEWIAQASKLRRILS